MIQLLPGIRIKVPNKHSTYGRVKVKTIQLISGKHNANDVLHCYTATFGIFNEKVMEMNKEMYLTEQYRGGQEGCRRGA